MQPRSHAALLLLLVLPVAACSGENVAGTYVLDSEVVAERWESTLPDDVDVKDSPQAKSMLDMLESMSWELTLEEDGTFSGTMTASLMGASRTTKGKGTWKADGDRIEIEIAAPDTSGTMVGTFTGNEIIVEEKMNNHTVELVFKRRS